MQRGDGRLWAIALGLSLLVNMMLVAMIGLATVHSEILNKDRLPVSSALPPAAETAVSIYPQMASAKSAAPITPAAPEKTHYARTSPDQTASKPEKPAFIGERATEATSDRAPVANAPEMPSQKGIAPKDQEDFETTESNYKDGKLGDNQATPPVPPLPPSPPTPDMDHALAENSTEAQKSEAPGNDDQKTSPPSMEHLLQGPNPVDVSVPKEAPKSETIKPEPPKLPKDREKSTAATDSPKPKPQPAIKDPTFSGFQRKAAITGSISRNGRSALAVADTPLGRYEATISRAVELEWQRNCVRHRDFITPGFLTVRFYVESSGRVRTVTFVGEMETGEVQKGFTLNSIRDAEIPAMPPSLKKEYEKEPLELIFNFYF
ncbi:MAG: hypothetical protein ABI073_05555 [Luteolibacter sp.]